MPKGLRRFHSGGDEHFITCSCYHREPFLAAANRRDLFLKILEEETVVQIPLWQGELPSAFWQKRYYDFSVFSQHKHAEKPNYMHNN
jgi:putative transposase